MNNHALSEKSEYKEVRGLVRGLDLLRALNSTPGGGASTSALAKACSMHRTTAKRLLETLRNQGVVQLGTKDGFYLLSDSVLQLSNAFQRVSWISEVALPIMKDAATRLRWACDIATYHEGHMVVRDSTQRRTAMAGHRALIGECLPMRTALGHAYLAALSDADLEELLDEAARCPDALGELATHREELCRIVEETRERGYALKDRNGIRRPHLGAVAVAVHGHSRPLAAINLVFENAVVTQATLENYYVPELRAVAASIEQAYMAWRERVAGAE